MRDGSDGRTSQVLDDFYAWCEQHREEYDRRRRQCVEALDEERRRLDAEYEAAFDRAWQQRRREEEQREEDADRKRRSEVRRLVLLCCLALALLGIFTSLPEAEPWMRLPNA